MEARDGVVLRCRGVTKRFPGAIAVDGVDLEVKQGQIMGLLGPSGCGKTTTLRLLAGFERLDAGIIEIGGRIVAGPGVEVPPERRKVGMVFQDYALFPHMSLIANVEYALRGAPGSRRKAEDLLDLVGLGALGNRLPHELSGGEQQRGALARSLAASPHLILLDEPFSNLDAALRAQVREEVRGILRAARATAVIVTHDREEALSIADEVAVMFDGKIVQVAEPEELYRRPASLRIAEWIGEANFLPGHASGGRAECELGALPVSPAIAGAVQLMLRPEWMSLRDDPRGAAVVVQRTFYGHDEMVRVRLDSGLELLVRILSADEFELGQRVCLEARARAVAYLRGG